MRKSIFSWTTQEDAVLQEHYGTISAKEIVARGLITRTVHSVHQRAFKLGLNSTLTHKLYNDMNLDFFKTPSLEAAYWAGFLSADGSLIKDPKKPNTYRLCLAIAVKDESHLRLFQKAMGHTGPIGYVTHPAHEIRGEVVRESRVCFVNICQAGQFRDDLAKFGIIPDKTKRIAPPQLDNNVLKLAFLKGYIDGDGCISVSGRNRVNVGFISSTARILHWFKELVEEHFSPTYLSRDFSIVYQDSRTDAWRYNVSGSRGLRMVEILSRIPTPELARKWKRASMLEIMENYRANPLHAMDWTTRLPIEDEIDAYIARLSTISAAA